MVLPLKQHLKSLLFLLTCLLFAYGCKGSDGAAGPTGPSLSGSLVGFAYLYDVNGIRATDNSGITVSIEGQTATATTNSAGKWVLPNLQTGIYTLVFSKAGYGTQKTIEFQFTGGGEEYVGIKSVCKLPNFFATGLSATVSSLSISLNGTLSGAESIGFHTTHFFVAMNSNVSSNPANYLYSLTLTTNSLSFSSSIAVPSLNSVGITSGQTIYIVAYGETSPSSSYVDLATGRLVYPNVSSLPSNVVSVVVP